MTRANPQYTPAAATAAPVKAHNVVLVHGSGASGGFRVFRASRLGDVSSWGPSQTRFFPSIAQATTNGAAVSLVRKMAQRPQMHQNNRHLSFANFPAKAPDTATAGKLSSSGRGFGIFGTTFRPVGEQS
jgi:hypothetical protein